MRRRVIAPALLLLVGMIVPAPALAICESARLIGLGAVVYTPGVPLGTGYMDSTVSPDFTGSFWSLGAGDPQPGAGIDSGTWEALADGWIYATPDYPAGGVRSGVSRTWAGSSKIDGCIDFAPGDRCMALLFSDQSSTTGSFALITAAPDSLLNYDLTPESMTVDLEPIPSLILVDAPPFNEVFSVPSVSLVEPGLDLDPLCSQDVVVGAKVYRSFGQPSSLDRDAGWELHPDGVGPEGTPLPLDSAVSLLSNCATGTVYYAISLVFDSGFETTTLSAPLGPFACDCNGDDQDGDGFCAGGDSSQTDCDDNDPTVYPGAPQLCDAVNNDCQDPNWPVVAVEELDDDGDGVPECAGDCDDDEAAVFPGAAEVCDGLNNDCDEPSWPLLTGDEGDVDGDGASICQGDCDEGNNAVYPGAPQVCDGMNNDCNDPDWPTLPPEEADEDGDGVRICGFDCDDNNPAVFPQAPQVCGDRLNNDCLDPAWPELTGTNEVDVDGDQVSVCGGDCDETSAAVYPGAPQVCDGLNNDCNDPNWPTPPNEETDQDGDGASTCDGDCNDGNATVFSGAPPLCDGLNNDCDDPNWPDLSPEEADADGDQVRVCDGDCDDTDANNYPGNTESCDGQDNDCDGVVDEGETEDCENGIDDDCDGLVDEADLEDCESLSVALESFTARYTRGSVLILWSTSSEIDNVGFRILRQRKGGKLVTVTRQLIPAAGTELDGASYQYVDVTRQPSGDIDYYLEDIDTQGRATRHGPVRVTIPTNRKENQR